MAEVNAALNTAAGAAHDERSVTLTREQWERVAIFMKEEFRLYSPSNWRAKRLAAINLAICEQAGLGEEFKCE